ncbi:MAG: dihydrofolate reductase family protein [Thermoplasmatota archaeon]
MPARRARKIVYFLAASADGFIARRDGNIDWLEATARGEYGAARFFARIDTIVWGRRTFDESAARGGVEPFGAGTRHVVLTRKRRASADPRVEFSREAPAALVRRLRRRRGKDIWIMGGAKLAASFVDAGLVDEIVVHVVPILLGDGIPLLAPSRRDVALELREARRFPDGVVRLRYAVSRTLK